MYDAVCTFCHFLYYCHDNSSPPIVLLNIVIRKGLRWKKTNEVGGHRYYRLGAIAIRLEAVASRLELHTFLLGPGGRARAPLWSCHRTGLEVQSATKAQDCKHSDAHLQ